MAMKSSILFNILFTASVSGPRHLIRREQESRSLLKASVHVREREPVFPASRRTDVRKGWTGWAWSIYKNGPNGHFLFGSPKEGRVRQSAGFFGKPKETLKQNSLRMFSFYTYCILTSTNNWCPEYFEIKCLWIRLKSHYTMVFLSRLITTLFGILLYQNYWLTIGYCDYHLLFL